MASSECSTGGNPEGQMFQLICTLHCLVVLRYNNSLEKLSAVVMKALDLAKLGVLDFSKM